MFARAVVLKGAGFALGNGALEGTGFNAAMPKDVEHLAGLGNVSLMGTAHNRQVAIAEAEVIQGSRSDDSQGLEGFQSRSRKAGDAGIARQHQQAPPIIAGHCLHHVGGFHQPFSQQANFNIGRAC
jgi:hypothetical protein